VTTRDWNRTVTGFRGQRRSNRHSADNVTEALSDAYILGVPSVTSDDGPAEQAVFEVLADPDCREILETLEDPLTAQEIATACNLPQTSTYRKLEHLSEADLVDEQTKVRTDGHHTTAYVRDCTGIFVPIEGEDAFETDILREPKRADERLAQFWTYLSDEL
jgi:DNA-binding transcriptional ArsR family regulator